MQESNQSTGHCRRSPSDVTSRIPAEPAGERLRVERVRLVEEQPSATARDQILRAAVAQHSVVAAQQTVRRLFCGLGQVPPGVPCTPDGDHLARWIGAYTAGQLSKADMATLFARVIVITKRRVVPELAA